MGYGRYPRETIELIRARGILCASGNHDRWEAAKSQESTLPPADMEFLAGLPSRLHLELEGVRILICHGSPGNDMNGISPEHYTTSEVRAHTTESGVEVLIVGHTHTPFALKTLTGAAIVNPGALLREPATEIELPAGGTFGVLELPSKRFEVYRASDGGPVDIIRETVGVRDRRRVY